MKTDWEAIYGLFDPEEPVPIEHPEWRVPRPYNPADQLQPALNRPFGDKRFLIIGTVGTGKSTELHQVAEARSERDFVVVVDLWHHFAERVGDPAALNAVQPWEVVFLIGLHLLRAADERGHRWPAARVQALADARASFASSAEEPTVDIPKLASAVSVLVGGALDGGAALAVRGIGKIAGTARWTLPIGRRARALDQEPRVQDMLAAVNALIGDLQSTYGKRVALFVDGLDRVRDLETVRQLFVESSLLGKLVCTTVMTGPIVVRRQGLGGALRSFDARVLANVPVIAPGSTPPDDDDLAATLTDHGRDFFRKAWSSRVEALGEAALGAIPDAQLDRLAWASGGRAREFVRLVRMVAERSYDAAVDVTVAAIVDAVIDARRRTFEMGINRHHLELLQAVHDDPGHELPDDPAIGELLDRYWLLPYPNESEWYAPNPLLMLRKLRGSGDSAAR